MEFRLLGPVELHVDGLTREIGPPQRRAVLAALAVDVGTPVPLDTLVDRVWDEPPQAARDAIYAHLTRIRRFLRGTGAGDPVPVARRAGGYVLQADPQTVDLHRFRRLVANAQDAGCTGEQRAAILTEAMRLWRGAPLEGVPGQWAERLRVGLEQQLFAAAAQWANAQLGLGRPQQVIDRLADLVVAYPLAEELVAALIRALCAADRVADAQEQYAALCSRLRLQLGAQPGPQLRNLYEALRRSDSAPPPAEPARTPRQLPGDVAGFTGRRRELASLRAALTGSGAAAFVRTVVIGGVGGIGKSGSAIHVAHQVAQAFPDGQLYADLRGATEGLPPLSPAEVLGRFLRAMGVPGREVPHDLDEAAARYRTLLAGKRMLVLLDNALDEAQVRPLLPGTAGSAVMVTSREMLSGLASPGHHLRLGALTARDALAMLQTLVGQERVAAEPQAAAAIAQWCGRLPLALRIAAARLVARPSWPLQALAERLAAHRQRLDELEVADRGVRTSFAVSHQHLLRSSAKADRVAAAAFAALGAWDGLDLGVHVAARLLGGPAEQTERTLERLADASLVEPLSPGRYRLHDLLRLYARELAATTPPAQRIAALDRVMRCYAATGWHALALLRPGDPRLGRADARWKTDPIPFTDAAAALAWLEAERANLLTVAAQAAGTENLQAGVLQLAPAVFVFFLQRGYWDDCAALNRIALTAAKQVGDLPAQAQALCDLGAAHEFHGRSDEALDCLQRSLATHGELGNRGGQAAILNNLGVIHSRQGRHREALRCARQSLAIHRELGNRNGQALNLDTIAATHARGRQYATALRRYQESLILHRELGSHWDEAKTLNGLAGILSRLARYDEALACIRQSLAICDELDTDAGRASNLDILGTVLHAKGQYAEALDCFERSIAIFGEIGQQQDVSEALNHAGATLRMLGRAAQAQEFAHRADQIRARLHLPPLDPR